MLNRDAGGKPRIGAGGRPGMSADGMDTGVPGVLLRLLLEKPALRLVTEVGLSVML